MKAAPRYLQFADRDEWRLWLGAHHTEADETWLVHRKKAIQASGLAYEAAVEEALCFGWIDGKLPRVDERRYVVRYTPRRANSVWSVSNIRRVERLIQEGRMTDAGLRRIADAKENGQREAAIRREQVYVIPPDLERALRQVEGAVGADRALPASRKKQFIAWLQSAKRATTKQRRIEKIVEEVVGS